MGSRAKRHTVDLLSKTLGTLCCWCRYPLNYSDPKDPHYRSIEHITPQKMAKLSSHMQDMVQSVGNKALACEKACNNARGDTDADEFRRQKQPERVKNRKALKNGRLR